MEVFDGYESFIPPANGAVLSIGNFDGVHRGHAEIIRTARTVANRVHAPVVAMTFDPHPIAILAPERAPAQLITLEEKLALLERIGVDACIVQAAKPDLFAMAADDFLASLVAHCHPRAFVEGPDFHFGRGRGGSLDTLRAHAQHWGFEVHAVPTVHCAELSTHPTISSTSIRQALLDGRVDEANAMLGRPYRVVGTIGHGAGRGAEIGFPTANLDNVTHLLPQHAVYVAVAQLPNGAFLLAAVNVGPQPTFDQEQSRVEAHLLDFTEDLRGQRIGLHLLVRIREQAKFPSVDALAAQLKRDVETTRTYEHEVEHLRATRPIALEGSRIEDRGSR